MPIVLIELGETRIYAKIATSSSPTLSSISPNFPCTLSYNFALSSNISFGSKRKEFRAIEGNINQDSNWLRPQRSKK